ncbi:redoxin domain-containing protein [Sulfurimonas sp.]
MQSKIKHYFKEILYFIVTMTILANGISLYKSQSLSNAPLNLSSVKLINNSIYTIDTTKPILINFWATWCPTCKLEAGNINLLAKKYQIITIAVQSGSDLEIQKYLHDHNYTYKVINDRDSTLARKFKIAGFPTTFIYDKNNNLVFKEVGYTSTVGLWLRILWATLRPNTT